MKNTIRNTVKEVYNTDLKNMKVMTPSLSGSPSLNVLNNENVVNKLANANDNRLVASPQIRSPQHSDTSFVFLIIIIILLVASMGAIYYFRDNIKDYLSKRFTSGKVVSKEVVEIKENGEELKEIKTVEEEKGNVIEKDKLTIKKDGGLIVEDKIVRESKKKSNKSNKTNKNGSMDVVTYSPNQTVSQDDMYCYVGKDDNMRQCIQVFKGDVCTSGDIFNRIDECLLPR